MSRYQILVLVRFLCGLRMVFESSFHFVKTFQWRQQIEDSHQARKSQNQETSLFSSYDNCTRTTFRAVRSTERYVRLGRLGALLR